VVQVITLLGFLGLAYFVSAKIKYAICSVVFQLYFLQFSNIAALFFGIGYNNEI